MQKSLKKVCLFITMFSCNNCYSQSDSSKWLKIQVINSYSEAKYFNIKFHYAKDKDSSWVFSFFDHGPNSYLINKDTAEKEIPGDLIHVNYYSFDAVINGHIVHKEVDSSFDIDNGKINSIKLPQVQLHIEWWNQIWIKIFVAVLAVLLIGVFLKYLRLRSKNKKLKEEVLIQKERSRISSEMHDDIGSGLFGITLQTERLKDKIVDEESVKKLLALHRSIQDISLKVKEVIWSLNSDNDTLYSLLSFIHAQSHKMFENTNVLLKISTADDLEDIIITGDKRRHILLLVTEALNNILKHANAQNAKLSFECINYALGITIQDDGKGFANLSTETIGIYAIENRVKVLGGKINKSDRSPYTILKIEIPFN